MSDLTDRFGLKRLPAETRSNTRLAARVCLWAGGLLGANAAFLWGTRLAGVREPYGFLFDEAVWATAFSAVLLGRGIQLKRRMGNLNG